MLTYMNKLASPFVELKSGGVFDYSAVGIDVWKFSFNVGIDIQNCTYDSLAESRQFFIYL